MTDHRTVSQVVVLAGGLGTRLGDRGMRLPKILQTVGGEPFIERLFRGYAGFGLTSVHLCLGHQSADVLAYLNTSPHPGLEVTYSIDMIPNGGTAAALRSAHPYLSDRFLLWLGDTYMSPEFAWPAGFDELTTPVMVLADRCFDVVPNAALTDDGLVSYAKAGGPEFSLVDTGVAILDPSFIDDPELRALSGLEECWVVLSARRRLAGFRTTAEVFDIGTPARINALEWYMRERGV